MERARDPIEPAVASALLWWADAGVDMMIDEEPRDWLRPKENTGIRSSRAKSGGAGTGSSRAPLDYARDERGGERLPDQLELFRAYLRDHDRLPYASPAARRVCPSGDPASGLMLLTDMPAAEDCAAGTLLSGAAGRLFERMLAAIGRDRASIYLASLSCLRSPDGRLSGEPAAQCAALARHHIGLAAPKALLLFGDAPSKALLGMAMSQARGRWHEIATHAGPVRTIVTIPPDFLLKQPSAKAHAWADLQLLMQGLQG
jgi:uracil-DNA glycosylase